MKFANSSGRSRVLLVALILTCAGLAGFGIWRSSALQRNKQPVPKVTTDEMQAATHALMQRGIAGQVKLAGALDSEEQVKASVDSAAKFIYERSGLYMSDETRKRLAQAEREVLKGNSPRLSVEGVTDAFTNIVSNRLAQLNDAEIEYAVNTFQPNAQGRITVRADGKWGYLTKGELNKQMKAGREWSNRGDRAVRVGLHSMIEEEVRDRLSALSQSAPEQFGDIARQGATPLQALLLAYSVATEDPLAGSQDELKAQLIQQRMATGMARPAKSSGPSSGKAYGVNGFLNSSPAYLLISKEAVGELITRVEGGGK